MPEPADQSPKRQIALRKGATKEGIAAELLMLLETITADGKIDDREASELQAWLSANHDADLPAISFLLTTLTQIMADGVITPEERKTLHRAVERVLPVELRAEAKNRHLASEAEEKTAIAALAEGDRAAANANRRITSANFMVAGVTYENRAHTIDSFLEIGQAIQLWREPQNPYDAFAIALHIDQGSIGYVPRDEARRLAGWLDAGAAYEARCTRILNGRLAPIPVIQVFLRRVNGLPESPARIYSTTPPEGATSRRMSKSGVPQTATGSGCLSCLGWSAVGICAILAYLAFK